MCFRAVSVRAMTVLPRGAKLKPPSVVSVTSVLVSVVGSVVPADLVGPWTTDSFLSFSGRRVRQGGQREVRGCLGEVLSASRGDRYSVGHCLMSVGHAGEYQHGGVLQLAFPEIEFARERFEDELPGARDDEAGWAVTNRPAADASGELAPRSGNSRIQQEPSSARRSDWSTA